MKPKVKTIQIGVTTHAAVKKGAGKARINLYAENVLREHHGLKPLKKAPARATKPKAKP